MSKPELHSHLFTVPLSVEELLIPGPNGLPQTASPAKIVAMTEKGTSLEVALEAMAQADLIIGHTKSQGAVGELDSLIFDDYDTLDSARSVNLENALLRRAYAAKVLSQATTVYEEGYFHEITATGLSVGRVLRDRDIDLILDLYDRTEEFDQHPLLEVMEKARDMSARISPQLDKELVGEADVLLRILFAKEVNVEPIG